MSMKGKVGVVTGGGSGIGRAISLQLAKEGVVVAVWDLNGAGAEETVGIIKAAGGQAMACTLDASDGAQIVAAAHKVRSALGPVTILVNNAGVTGFCKFSDITEEMWDRMMQINLKGPFLCIKAMLPEMLAAGWGRIVNITSSSTQVGASRMAHYVASKGGLGALSRSLAVELATSGVTINNIPPSFVDTPMLRASPVDIEAYAASMVPMKRPGKPEDIAAACSYLVSEAASYITGQTINVNGGRYLGS